MSRLVACLFVVASIVSGGSALACRCAEYGPSAAALARADVVVSGTVTGVVIEGRIDRTAFIQPDRVFKGDVRVGDTMPLVIGTTSCRLPIAQGETWLVFAKREANGQLTSRQCMGSTRLAAAGAPVGERERRVLERLGK